MMPNSVTEELLRQLPKCEHHLHIEGSLEPSTLFKLARRNNVALPDSSEDPAYASEEALVERYAAFSSLDDFLGYYYRAMRVLLSAQDFEELAWAYFERAHADGLAHAEIFFDPQAHMERGVSFNTVVQGLSKGRLRAERELGITSELCCCFLRHLPPASALELVRNHDFISSAERKDFIAIGLDSSETNFPPELFETVYREAKAMGLRLTAHAGEEGPAENIAKSIDILGCERIDHGIKLSEDVGLMQQVAQKGIMLTVCPLSNVSLRCVSSVEQVPIRKFLEANVLFSINSDDPTYLGGFILDNYIAVQKAFDLTRDDWRKICKASIAGSWCSGDRKAELHSRLDSVLAAS